MKKKILIIHTGGTISMVENKTTGEVTTATKHPLSELTYYFNQYADVEEMTAFSLPSPHIEPRHMLQLANRIKEELPSYEGIVVTHGTDTLEETAFFLDLIVHTDKPIIITGAMRSSNEIGSDALYNLISSIRVASDGNASKKGVLVVMNDEVHTARNVTKTSTSNIATFQSPQYGPLGIITKDSIIFHHTITSRYCYNVDAINQRVYLLKAYAGMDNGLLEAVLAARPDGLVIEALGQGNLPKESVPYLAKIMEAQIPIVLVSRCFQGIVQPTYGYEGGGRKLKEMGVIFSNGLTGPKARIKLQIALEQKMDFPKLKDIFEKEN
ncbi:asparaginase [Oceanobacillus sp. M65]|uniref:asparaginase n=1 Tax=Oceanobacillus jordanicus TaxID=2867266 RepID=A0AAW5B2U2_9BACI|nr:asparaginase [Oceanobacillus jordanicus]AVQ99254.1 L-asparaginase [Oceanobacillus iheyensis]MCG3418825.1 asparaginase [Oceanobacillus jordanicus]